MDLGRGRDLLFGFLAFNLGQVLVTGAHFLAAPFLSPGDLGLVGLASAATTLVEQVRDFGLREALIRERDLSRRLVDAFFWHFVAAGLLLGAALWGAAPWLARCLRAPELGPVLRLVCWVVPLGGAASVPSALLVRGERYGRLLLQEAPPFGVYLLVALVEARAGAGYWALAQASLACAALRAALYLTVFRPGLRPDLAALRRRMPFGAQVLWQGLLFWGYEHGLRLSVGRALGPGVLGLLSMGLSLSLKPLSFLARPVVQMSLPHFARVQAAGGDLAQAHLRLAALSLGVAQAVALALAAGVPRLVVPLLGAQWREAGELASFLAPVCALSAPEWLTAPVLQALGRPGVFSRFLSVKVALELAALLWALRWGLWPFLWCFAVLEAAFALAGFLLARRELSLVRDRGSRLRAA